MAEVWTTGYELIEVAMSERPWLTGTVFVFLGAALALFGARTLQVTFALISAAAAGFTGAVLGYGAMQTVGAMALGLLLAVLAGSIIYSLYVVSVFLAGASAGLLASWVFMAFLGLSPVTVVLGLSALATAIIALTMEDKVLMVFTAITGGLMMASGAANLLWAEHAIPAWQTGLDMIAELRTGTYSSDLIWLLAGWGIITVTGIAVQMLIIGSGDE